MVEASIGSWRCAPGISNSGIIDEKRGHDDFEIQLSGDSDIDES